MSDQTRYTRLAKITHLINSNLDLKVTLQHVIIAISEEVVRCNSVGIYLPQSDGTLRGYVGKPNTIDGISLNQMIIDPNIDKLSKEIIQTNKSIYIPDTSVDNRPDPNHIQLFKIRSLLGIPISYGDELFGIVFLFDYGIPMNLSTKEIQTVEAYVNMAAVAIRNANLFNHTQSLLSEKKLLLDVSRELALCSSSEEIFYQCFSYIEQVLDNRNIGIHICDSLGEKFRPVKLNKESDWTEKAWINVFEQSNFSYEHDAIFQKVIRTKKPVLIPDVTLDHRPNKEVCKRFGIKGLLILPLVATGEVLGTISVVSLEGIKTYSDVELQIAQSIVDITSTALANVMCMEQLSLIIDNRTAELVEKNNILEEAVDEIKRLSHQKDLILNSAGEGIYGLDLDGIITFCNPAAARMLGYEVEELIGTFHLHILKYLDDPVQTVSPTSIEVDSSIFSEDLLAVEANFYRKDASYFPGEYISRPIIRLDKVVGAVVTFKNITERKKTEDILRKTDKLSVIGELAAGVAHEIRNPLTSLRGFIQLLQSNSNEHKEYYDIMLTELERINGIANEFLFLAKPQMIYFEKKDILPILNHVITLLHNQAMIQNVKIFIDSEFTMLEIKCAENQLKQAFINILKNAIEAMPSGGTIKIKVRKEKNNTVSIRFIDSGFGISKERISLLGEPFYTTKEKGSGLGLMVSYKIIKDHLGDIIIKSKKSNKYKGTLVDVNLPIE